MPFQLQLYIIFIYTRLDNRVYSLQFFLHIFHINNKPFQDFFND